MLSRALGLTGEGKRRFWLGALACALANLVLMGPVAVLFVAAGDFMAALDGSAPHPPLGGYLLAIAGVLVAMVLTQWLEYASTYHCVYDESARKRVALANRLRKLPLSFFGKRDLADLTSVVMKDCSDQERMFMHVMPQLFGTGLSTVVIVAAMFVYDWRLACAAFWVLPVVLAIMALTSARQGRAVRAMEVDRLAMADGIQEHLECIRETRAANLRRSALADLDARFRAFERSQISSELVSGSLVSSAQALLKLGIGTTVLAGVALLAAGEVGFMTFFAFVLVVTRAYDPIDIILQSITELLFMRVSIRRTQELMDEPIQEGSLRYAPQGHDIVFDNVSFAYEGSDAPVLSGVSLTAREGQVTALVGPSGCGKSTCLKLVARLWDADGGTVSVGGMDVSRVDPEALLADVSEVFQDVVLFDDTVLNNIRVGRREATDEEVRAAARAANCDSFVSALPEGYDTLVGENGSRLSGGERQRISIARALLKDAPIVLLDEATASLDVENETEVQRALSTLLAHRTVLVVAHRMRTVADVDHVVVLAEGRVVEQGSPRSLMAREGGVFRRMAELQGAMP